MKLKIFLSIRASVFLLLFFSNYSHSLDRSDLDCIRVRFSGLDGKYIGPLGKIRNACLAMQEHVTAYYGRPTTVTYSEGEGCKMWYMGRYSGLLTGHDTVYENCRDLTVSGGGGTCALPQGPAIDFTASINVEGAPVSDKYISISMIDEYGIKSVRDFATDQDGRISFKYVPPYFRSRKIVLNFDCKLCHTPIQKEIFITNCAAEEMCRR